MKTVGERIKEAVEYRRHSHEWSIRRLQKALVDQRVPRSAHGTFYRYLKGKGTPPPELIKATADLLGVNYAWLALGRGEMTGGGEDVARLAAEAVESPNEQEDPYSALPFLDIFPEEVRALFVAVWKRHVEGTPGVLDTGEILRRGAALGSMVLAPLGVWGFEHDLATDERRYSEYMTTMLLALSHALPDAGQGDEPELRGTLYSAGLMTVPVDEVAREGLAEAWKEKISELERANKLSEERFRSRLREMGLSREEIEESVARSSPGD